MLHTFLVACLPHVHYVATACLDKFNPVLRAIDKARHFYCSAA